MISQDLIKFLKQKGQEHLLEYLSRLEPEKQENLIVQLADFDWSLLELLDHNEQVTQRGHFSPMKALEVNEIIAHHNEYEEIGLEAIRKGEIAAVLLAGGQGSRLGFEGPKGTFNIGKTKFVPIFQLLIENMKYVAQKAGAWIHFYIMTSELNHEETVAFFEKQNYFDYPQEYIHFFIQDMEATVDFQGKLFMSEMDRLAYSPNGNGGWFMTMVKRGLLPEIHKNGIKWINVFSVDNVLQKIADPVFIGATLAANVTCGAKALRKNDPYEKVGALCYEDGIPSIVEYYDLSDEMANAKDDEGRLLYGYGVILNYLFSVENLEKIINKKLPIHLAKKKISYMQPDGKYVTPTEENGYKFEYLVLDMIQHMDSCLPYEVVREQEFAPVKNPTGVDSVESAQKLLELAGIKL